jgi:hypothetical protein
MKVRLLVVGFVLAVTAAAQADTLVLTNGRRLQGTLVGVTEREIEFEDRSGLLRRVLRVPRQDVVRIELGDAVPSPVRVDEPGTARPRGMRERQVQVLGNERWTDTGIDVREGQMLYFASSGEVRWGPRNRKDGAAGERNSPSNSLRPIPDRPAAALIGRIGPREEAFFIGADTGPFRARESGRLYLAINDDWLEDNVGALKVNVSF